MCENPRQLFFTALNLFQQGDADQAESFCRRLLSLNSCEVNTLRLWGQIAHSKGDLVGAEKAFLKAVNNAPDYAHAYMDLGALMRDRGDFSAAERYLKKALALNGKLTQAIRVLHDVLVAQGKTNDVRELTPNVQDLDKLNELVEKAYQFFVEKNYDEMEAIGREVLSRDAENLPIMRLLADYAASERISIRSENLFRRILQKAPENWRAWNGLARALTIQDRPEEGMECLARSREINPDASETQMLMADAYLKAYEFNKGIEIYEKLVKEMPDHTQSRTQLGLALKTVGRQSEAIEHFKRCIANDNACGEAYWSLSDLKVFAFSDRDVEIMEHVITNDSLSEKNQVYINYALGKAYEHRKDYGKSFGYYDSANEIQRGLIEYSAENNSAYTDELISVFNNDLISHLASRATYDVTPIFIVGLPRSGSTLLEQILASHPQVEGTQELSYMPRLAKEPFSKGLHELNLSDIEMIAQRYLQQATFHRKQGTPFFIDKLPNNFTYIGLILLCFPSAIIINAKRHPLDSCLGCFKQLWAMGQHFTYDQKDLGKYYRDYDRLMKHWHRLFPGRILDVQYESVVEDLESQVRRLLEFCNLSFQQSCIEFHRTKRVVKTSSSEQVRKPIYTSALNYWKNYEEYLGPLKKLLEDLVIEQSNRSIYQ